MIDAPLITSVWPNFPRVTQWINGKCVYAPHYFRWRAMRARCYQPTNDMYYLYGKRGITVCEEWSDFWTYMTWALKTHIPGRTMDRINNDGQYSPANCRWATASEQQANIRPENNKKNATKKAVLTRKLNGYADIKFRKRGSDGKFV